MIRTATSEDIPRLVEMGLRFIAESTYQGRLASSPHAMTSLMEKLLAHEDGLLMVSEQDGKIVGMLGGFVYVQPISGQKIAGEAFWWMEPEHRKGGDGLKLGKMIETWGRKKGAQRATLIAPTDDVARICTALGYAKLETHFQRDL